MGKLSSSAYLKNSARHVAASLRYTRNYALARGVESSFNINLAKRTYTYTGNNQAHTFKPTIDLDVFSATSQSQLDNLAVIRFAPDGSSSGGRIILSSNNKKYIVYVDWLTGRVGVDKKINKSNAHKVLLCLKRLLHWQYLLLAWV